MEYTRFMDSAATTQSWELESCDSMGPIFIHAKHAYRQRIPPPGYVFHMGSDESSAEFQEDTQAHKDANRTFYNSLDAPKRASASPLQGPMQTLRAFNNWAKLALMHQTFSLWTTQSKDGGASIPCVLDIAGGRGGDLWKWEKVALPKQYILIDSAMERIMQAHVTVEQHFTLNFRSVVFDALRGCERPPSYDPKLSHIAPPGTVTIAWCQFALNYFVPALPLFLQQVYHWLAPGGFFAVTWTRGESVLNDMRSPSHTLHSIHSMEEHEASEGPQGYHFTLGERVEAWEYLLTTDQLLYAAHLAGLDCVWFLQDITLWTKAFPQSSPPLSALAGRTAKLYGQAIFRKPLH